MLRLFYSLSCTILFMSVLGADFPQCDNEPMKSIIAVASNCSRAIYCNGMESVVLDCSKETPYFSTTDQKCHNSSTVCDNRPVIVHNMLTTTPLSVSTNNFSLNSNTPTTAISDLFTRSTTTSIQQSFPTTWSTNQADTTIREPLTSPAFTTSTSQPTSAATQAVPVFVQCPEVDDLRKPLFLPHPKSCSRYFLCYHGVATPMKCPNKLHFDVSQQTCNTPEQAKCQVLNVMSLFLNI